MKNYVISGIQQMGVGVKDVHEAWKWYRNVFGMDVPIFEEEAEANLMLPYTGGKPQSRHAVLAMNLQSGGGFEIWQYKGRKPKEPVAEILAGDLGIFSCKMKVKDIDEAIEFFRKKEVQLVAEPAEDPLGNKTFFVRDPYNNIFQFVRADDWFMNENKVNGGAYGAIIGVKDIDRSLGLYSDILGYDKIAYDKKGKFSDLGSLPGGDMTFRRVLLQRTKPFKGAFTSLFGDSVIELISVEGRTPENIYRERYWGDPGFIHLCYDIKGMDQLKEQCASAGYSFTVDSKASFNSKVFDMGEAAGHFAYIEDPDGTLIEFVEALKVPLVKKLGWYLDMTKRHPEKRLPSWMIKTLRFSKVKDK